MGLTAKKVYAILNGKIRKISGDVSDLGTPLFYAGSVETSDLLPLSPKTGAVYNIEQKSIYGESGTNVAWNGTLWDALGPTFDLSLLLTKEEAEEQYIKKQQGIENVGKALVIGEDGTVIPKEIQEESGKIDSTLTQSGQAADAQVTGREIATLHQGKADAIVETVQGETMTLTDSSDKLFEGLRVFGKSTQDGTPSVEMKVPIVNAGESGNIVVTVNGAEPQSLTLATPNGLPGVPVSKDGNYTDKNGQQWICNEIDLGREKYVQRVLKTKPRRTIVFNKRDENGRCSLFGIPLFGIKWMQGNIPSLSSIAQWSEWGNGVDGTFALASDGIYYKDTTKTLEEINVIFSKLGTNIEFCGVLASPVERDLTPEEIQSYKTLRTNYPSTVISNNENAGMEVSYVADTKLYIDKKFEELNQAVVNTQKALI